MTFRVFGFKQSRMNPHRIFAYVIIFMVKVYQFIIIIQLHLNRILFQDTRVKTILKIIPQTYSPCAPRG